MTSAPVVVFAGLSLSREEARKLIAAEIRPPAKRGDLDALSDRAIVAIIDGDLDDNRILPVAEVRQALRRGLKISGAASTGAFLAHKVRKEGMVGRGWVYEAYHSRRIVGTDEIEVVYEPVSYRPLTIPLINVRFCLDILARQDAISTEEAGRAMSSLKRWHLERRTSRAIILHLARLFGRRRTKGLLPLIRLTETNVKRNDAHDLLRGMTTSSHPNWRNSYSRTVRW